MPQSADDLSALFRSLGPDEPSFQAAETVVAREAAQRWPLFQAMSPKKPATTPVLSIQERQRWSHQSPVGSAQSKPALSLPGLSNKIATSLGKMSGREEKAPIQNRVRRAQPDAPLIASRSQRSVPQKKTQAIRNVLSSDASLAIDSLEPPRSNAGLFGPEERDSQMAIRAVPVPAVVPTDDSLASVFSRLERKPQDLVKPTNKKSSFLQRLGKR